MHSVIECLPYVEDFQLSSVKDRFRVLKLLSFLYSEALHSFSDFMRGHFSSFDAQVSDNLCQIRAFQLLEIIDQKIQSSLVASRIRLELLLQKTDELLLHYQGLQQDRPSHYEKSIDQSLSLSSFVDQLELGYYFDSCSFLLVQTYILSKYKIAGEYDMSNGINYNYFCHAIKIDSKTFARKWIHRLQRNVSEISSQFVFKWIDPFEKDGFS